jgi:hypothetical protein
MRITKRIFVVMTAAIALVGLLAACDWEGSSDSTATGTMNLSITDAPIDASTVTGVYITVQSVQYNLDDEWGTMEGFEGPETFNLLELTNGASALLGSLSLPAGEYTQIRFILDAPADTSGGPPSNPGSYVTYTEESGKPDTPLFVPSGAQTGYKVVADEPFVVPENGEIDITVDFDLRKSIVVAGSRIILKPVLRLVVEAEAGTIGGSVTYAGSNSLVVFAYEAGAYDSATELPTSDEENGFDNAVSSANVTDTGEYTLAFLPAGTYDLVVAGYGTEGAYVPSSAAIVAEDIEVEAGETVSRDLMVVGD